jgi:hypothetical protein
METGGGFGLRRPQSPLCHTRPRSVWDASAQLQLPIPVPPQRHESGDCGRRSPKPHARSGPVTAGHVHLNVSRVAVPVATPKKRMSSPGVPSTLTRPTGEGMTSVYNVVMGLNSTTEPLAEPIDAGTRLQRDSDIVAAAMGREIAMMDMESGKYFVLDEIAASIWTRLETPATLGELCGELSARYDVTAEQCAADIAPFLESLLARRLVRIVR